MQTSSFLLRTFNVLLAGRQMRVPSKSYALLKIEQVALFRIKQRNWQPRKFGVKTAIVRLAWT
tara:strand:- start:425 stop:613 length:189 start_codon:yes stop_codon:yes gene_type:complete